MTAEAGSADGGWRAPNNTRDAPVRDDPAVIGLVTRARSGDRQAWDLLVERYSPLIWSICRRYRLDGADAEDVGQTVWLKLVEQLRQSPRAGRASRLAGYHDPTGMPPSPKPRAEAARCRGYAGSGERPRRSSLDGGGHAGSRASRDVARCVHDPAPRRPAADRPAHRRPSRAVRRDQREAGHTSREHRAEPKPLPGQAAPPPGHRRLDECRQQYGG